MTLSLLTFIAVFSLILSGALLFLYRAVLQARLQGVVAAPGSQPLGWVGRLQSWRSGKPMHEMMYPFQKMLPRSPQEISVAEKRLLLANFRKDYHINILYGMKVLVPVVVVVLATVTRLYTYGPFFVYALGAALGFLAPDFWLGNRIRARQLKLRMGLPEALDLMVICIEAGLGLDQTIVRVADELALSQPEMAEELTLLNLEQRAGRPRADALRNLSERTDVDSIRSLVTMLIQTDHFGTSLADALRVHSDSLRTQRRQQAEEEAAKTTVKLVFPLVFFIFPSLFLVILGPSLITIFESFDKYLLN